jgi:hypothetical protein
LNPKSPWLKPADTQAMDLAYHRAGQCSPQWRAFLAALITELNSGAEGDEVRNFLRQVGKRLAAANPLPKVETLEELQAAMNRLWLAMDWGWVRLAAAPDGVRIVHGAYPDALGAAEKGDEDGEPWPAAWAAVLEGVYTVWLKAQGSPIDRTTRVGTSRHPLELFHGL